MKKTLFITLCLLGFAFAASNAQPYRTDRMFNYFYHSLTPYGEWVEIDYQVYAWRPMNVRYGWTPYRDGRWMWTNYGWYWDSYEPYGWAVYHYGRWIYDDYYGWLWLPDNEWGPAWVEWRYYDDYVGWAPLPPYASFQVNVGIHFSITWNSPHIYWTFVDVNHFCGVHISRYVVRDEVRYRIFPKTKYRTNYTYVSGRVVNGGIDRKYVERRSGVTVTQRTVEYSTDSRTRDGGRTSSGDRNVSAYRPDEGEISRYDSRSSDITVTRSDRKSSLQVDRMENNIYRDRTSSGGRTGTESGTVNRERNTSTSGSSSRDVNNVESRGTERTTGSGTRSVESGNSGTATERGTTSGRTSSSSGNTNSGSTTRSSAPSTMKSVPETKNPQERSRSTYSGSQSESSSRSYESSGSTYSGGNSSNSGRESRSSSSSSGSSNVQRQKTESAPAARNGSSSQNSGSRSSSTSGSSSSQSRSGNNGSSNTSRTRR